MAAEALGWAPPLLVDLARELSWPEPPPDLRWVEAAGGVRSPVATDGDSVELCDILQPDLVVLVADAGLGTINAVRLSRPPLSSHDVMVVLNRFDPTDALHVANRSWLAGRDGFDVVWDPSQVAATILERATMTTGFGSRGVQDPA